MTPQLLALLVLAAGLLSWPPTATQRRLRRLALSGGAGGAGGAAGRSGGGPGDRGRPTGPARWLPALGHRWGAVAAGAAVGLGLLTIWPAPLAACVGAVSGAAIGGVRRIRTGRAFSRADAAAVEALGVVVAELQAGRQPGFALDTAARYCSNAEVATVLAVQAQRQVWGGSTPEAIAEAGTAGAGAGGAVPAWQASLMAGLDLSARTGAAMAEVVGAVQADLATRIRQRDELRAASSGNRATVALLAGLPVLGVLMGSGIGAAPLQVLLGTRLGQILLCVGVGLELAGLAWSRRLTQRAVPRI